MNCVSELSKLVDSLRLLSQNGVQTSGKGNFTADDMRSEVISQMKELMTEVKNIYPSIRKVISKISNIETELSTIKEILQSIKKDFLTTEANQELTNSISSIIHAPTAGFESINNSKYKTAYSFRDFLKNKLFILTIILLLLSILGNIFLSIRSIDTQKRTEKIENPLINKDK